MVDLSEEIESRQPGVRTSTIVLLASTLIIPTIFLVVKAYDNLGLSLAPVGRVITIEIEGDFGIVLDGGSSPGSYTFHILELPSERRKRLVAGDVVRLIEQSGETFAKVEVLSGSQKGQVGWVGQELLSPGSQEGVIQWIENALGVLFLGVLLIYAAKLLKWVIDDPNAIYARKMVHPASSGPLIWFEDNGRLEPKSRCDWHDFE